MAGEGKEKERGGGALNQCNPKINSMWSQSESGIKVASMRFAYVPALYLSGTVAPDPDAVAHDCCHGA